MTGSDAISLSFAASQSPAVSGLDDTASITWQRDLATDPSGRTLLGKIGGVTVITLTLTGDVTAAGGGDTATPTVTAMLSDNFPHRERARRRQPDDHGTGGERHRHGRRDHHRDRQRDGDRRRADRRDCCGGRGWDADDGQRRRGRHAERDVDAERRRRRRDVDHGVGGGPADPGCDAAWRWACACSTCRLAC